MVKGPAWFNYENTIFSVILVSLGIERDAPFNGTNRIDLIRSVF
jgi:hypothetical protein